MKNPFDNRTLWQRIKWSLFGETKILYWGVGGLILANLLLLGGFAFVVLHFVFKFW